MKYEDLTRMYWDINRAVIDLNELCGLPDTDNTVERLNWCLATIDEELRNIESYSAQCN